MVLLAAAGLFVSACGYDSTTNVSSPAGICEEAKLSANDAERLAQELTHTPMADATDISALPREVIDAQGIELRLGAVTNVRHVEQEPFNILPGEKEGDPPTNSFAGNSAFWTGIVLDVDLGDTSLSVPIEFAVGGADVLESYRAQLDRKDLSGLDHACVVLAIGNEDLTPNYGPPVVAAIGTDKGGSPLGVHGGLANVVDDSDRLDDLVTDRG